MTVISTLQSATYSGAANTQGFALQAGEQRRMPVHNEACQADGVSFIPLVAESLGGWSEEAIFTITCLLGQHTGTSPNDTTRHLFQHLAIYLLLERECNFVVDHMPAVSAWTDWKV